MPRSAQVTADLHRLGTGLADVARSTGNEGVETFSEAFNAIGFRMPRRSEAKGRLSGGLSADDLVQLESQESFPASDSPSWPIMRVGSPAENGEPDMTESMYPASSPEIRQRRRELAPDIHKAFDAFSQKVFAEGALPAKTKQLIAVAVAHVTQCPYCIRGHTTAALRHGASHEELMEAIWVAAEMRAGGAFAHSTIALDTMTTQAK